MVATFLCKGLSVKILQNPNLSFHKNNFPTELNGKQGERGEVFGHIYLPVLFFKHNLSIKNNKECKIHNKAFWLIDCIKLWETGMISTFWSPVKSSALRPSANPSQLGVVHQHWAHSHEPKSPHPISSYLTCSGYKTSPVNLKTASSCSVIFQHFNYHFADCWLPISQLNESQQLFWPSSYSFTLRFPLQNFCCGGLFLSTHTLLNKHLSTNIRSTHTHKKTINFNNGDYSNNCKIVTKILHKDVSTHINKREFIKNGKQLFLINVGFAKLTHWKRHWCWERLKVGGEADNRGWDGWMASPTQWTWIWVNSGSWWWTGRPGVLQSMDSQKVWHDWATELNLATLNLFFFPFDLGHSLQGS